MAFNASTINSVAINAESSAFTPITGSGTLVDIEQIVGEVGSGSLVSVEQIVGRIGSGTLVDIEQETELRLTGSGTLVDIEQELQTVGSGSLVDIVQHVFSSSISSHYERNGWDLIVKLGGATIANSNIHGAVTVEHKEGASSLAEFTLIPGSGAIDLNSYLGKSLTIDSITANGVERIFTGVVDIPEVDIIGKRIRFRCSNRRRERLADLESTISQVGFYSEDVFGKANVNDIATQLDNRLTTVPKTLDFDNYGTAYVTDLLAKSTPDYTLVDSDIFYRNPKVDLLSRTRVVNSVNVKYKYRYTRKYHWTKQFSWESPLNANFCLFLNTGWQLTPKGMITDAALAAGWPINGTISFTATPSAGWLCGVGWLGAYAYGQYTQVTDENDNVVSDTEGEPIYSFSQNGATQLTSIFATQAIWYAGTRWTQVIEEDHEFNITAPQSITQYGEIKSEVQSSFETDFDGSTWEDYKSYNTEGLSANHAIDEDSERQQFNAMQNVIINIAKTRIIRSHRDTRVTFFRTFWPEIDLSRTVRVDTDEIVAQGKVTNIKHSLDCRTGEDTTEITLSLSKSQGAASDTVPGPQPKLADIPFDPDQSIIYLQSRYGQDPENYNNSDTWNGYVGNITIGFSSTNFPARFIVDTPEIPQRFRNLRTITSGTSTYNVVIQDDDLEINF